MSMSGKKIAVYGIGNPLIDVQANCSEEEIRDFGLEKGTMHLIDSPRNRELLQTLEEKEKQYCSGGSCLNTMIAMSHFGTTTAYGGKIGNDELGSIYQQQLAEQEVLSDLSTHSESTGTSIILVSPDSERTMNTHLGSCRYFSGEDVNYERLEQSNFFYFTGYMWDTESQKDAILKAISHAEASNTRIVFDVADPFAVERNREEFLELIENHASIVFANQREAEILFGESDPAAAAQQLGEIADIGVVKNGAEGSFVVASGDTTEKGSSKPVVYEVPVVPADPVDSTGAGDVYAGGFLHMLANGGGPEEAGQFASYLASRIVEQWGAQFTQAARESICAAWEDGSWKTGIISRPLKEGAAAGR